MNGVTARSSHSTSATHNVMALQRAIHCVLGSASRNISRAHIAAPNSTMPPASMRLAISHAVRCWSRSSLGTHAIVSNRAMTAAGILTRNVERQPKASTSTPPMGRPTATVTVPAIDSPPSTRPGGSPSPADVARRRMISIAAGYPAEVPIPTSTRATAATGMSYATPPIVPPRSTRRMPANSTRRGPNCSATLPAAGCAIALARYSADTRIAVCPTGTFSACAMGTNAVAISELLIGLSVAATYSGLTKRHENAPSCRSTPNVVALQEGLVLVRNVRSPFALGRPRAGPAGHPARTVPQERVRLARRRCQR